MILHVIEARYLHDYVIWILFNEEELEGEVFSPLKKVEKFRGLNVDAELNTVVWGNVADFAPEFLREKIRVLT